MTQKPMPLMTFANRALIRAGLKWQTRRTHGLDRINQEPDKWEIDCVTGNAVYFRLKEKPDISVRIDFLYQVGDKVYLREPCTVMWNCGRQLKIVYCDNLVNTIIKVTSEEYGKWKERKCPHRKTSSMFMYKSLARTWRRITRVWIERTQEISVKDIKAEGWPVDEILFPTVNTEYKARKWFKALWDSINLKRGYGYDANTYNFCYEWEVIEK